MATTPEELLQAAETFVDASTEVDWRNAAICGYYAAFHKCIPFAYGGRTARPGHSELIDMLARPHSSPAFSRAGILLRHSKVLRERATYRLEVDFARRDAHSVLSASRQVFDIVDGAQ